MFYGHFSYKAAAKYCTAAALAGVVLAGLILVNRTNVLDNDNYLNYFANPDGLSDLSVRIWQQDSILGLIAMIFSEEIIWRVYAGLLGFLFSPEMAVSLTVLVLNAAVFAGLARFKGVLLGTILWIVLPMCLPVVGFFQIRQGLAFAIFSYFFLFRRGHLVVAATAAACIHTTFVIPLIIVVINKLVPMERRPVAFILSCLGLFALMTSVGGYLFAEFAGRRGDIYEVDDGASSVNYIIGVWLLNAPAVALMLDRFKSPNVSFGDGALESAGVYLSIGVLIWLTCSFFLFPIGTSRVGYYAAMFSIFPVTIAWERLGQRHKVLMAVYALAVVLLIYGGLRSGTYAEFSQSLIKIF